MTDNVAEKTLDGHLPQWARAGGPLGCQYSVVRRVRSAWQSAAAHDFLCSNLGFLLWRFFFLVFTLFLSVTVSIPKGPRPPISTSLNAILIEKPSRPN